VNSRSSRKSSLWTRIGIPIGLLGLVGALLFLPRSIAPAGAVTPTSESWAATLSCNADSNGFCTVAHPAGVVPQAVVVTPTTPSLTSVDNLTATSFRIKFFRAVAADGTVSPLRGKHRFSVHVDWSPDGPGQSPMPTTAPSSSAPASTAPSPPAASPSSPSNPSPSTAPAGWPGPANTGVPSGVVLSAYTGPCSITVPNTVIDAKDVTCDLRIATTGVRITRSRIHGEINGGEGAGSSFRVEDSEVINGKRSACQCIGPDNFTVVRTEIRGGNRGVYCRLNCTVQDSWIHGTDLLPLQHASSVRVEQHSTVRHNTLACDWTAITDSEIGCSADMTGYPDFAPIHHNTITGNLFVANPAGLGYCAYGGATAGKPFSSDPTNATYIVFTDNVFQRGSKNRCGTYGPITSFSSGRTGNVWSGNTWDTGEPVSAAM
jgi:hypothetical protein